MIHYFAYGSNLHPARLIERVPSVTLVGPVKINGYRLIFHKQGQDGSAKCNLKRTDRLTDIVHGAIYILAAEHKCLLDEFEGRGKGYLDHRIDVARRGQMFRCFTYLAQEKYISDSIAPYHWYKELVLHGARYLYFPRAYLSVIEAVNSKEDPLEKRRRANDELLQRMGTFPAWREAG